jgi:lysozyme family protein
MGNYLVSDR